MDGVDLLSGIDGNRPHSMEVYRNAVLAQLRRHHSGLVINEVTLSYRPLPFASAAINRYLRYFPRARGCSAAVAHILDQNNAPAALLLPRTTRVVITVHDFDPAYWESGFSRAFLHAQAMGLRRADALCAVSESTKKDLLNSIDYPADQVRVCPNGVDHAVFRPIENPATKVDDGFFELLHVGSEVARKNLPFLLQVIAELRKRHARVRLTRVGRATPAVEKAIESLGLGDSVRYLGNLSDEQVAEVYRQSDLLLFPSTHEGYGLPVAEAMACGCPVLASDKTSIPEVGGDAVLYASPSDHSAWIERIGQVIRDRDLRMTLKNRGLARARSLTWQAHVDALVALYAGRVGHESRNR